MRPEYPKVNPVVDLLRDHNISLTPAWLPHESQCYHHDQDEMYDPYRIAPTIPGSPNYIPPMRPAHIPFDDWTARVSQLMAESAYGFIADVWTSILTRKDPASPSTMFMLWNEDIPKPNRLTALFWLFMCETWPLLSDYTRVKNVLKYRAPDESSLTTFHPPQPFVLPVSQHYDISSILPVAPARGPYQTATHENLKALFAHNLSKHHRDMMSNRTAQVPAICLPAGQVSIQDHILDQQMNRIHERINGVTEFAYEFDSHIVCGHALLPVAEAQHHTLAIDSLRRKIMSRLSIIPGFPTSNENIHGCFGGWIRSFSTDNLYFSGQAPTQMPWGIDEDPVIAYGKKLATHIPLICPKMWFGFTGLNRWLRPIEEHKAQFEWADAYLEHRPFALRLLFESDQVNLNEARHEQLVRRTNILTRAKRFATGSLGGTSETFANVFKAFGESIRKH